MYKSSTLTIDTIDDVGIDIITAIEKKLDKDIKLAAEKLQDREARYLVDQYYQLQDIRIRSAGQIRSVKQSSDSEKDQEPHIVLEFVLGQSELLENNIRIALGIYASHRITGAWSQSITGIGPVISAGLLANISMEHWECMEPKIIRIKRKPKDRCTQEKPCSQACHLKPTNTVGQIWKYAGLDPTTKWNKGEIRPWNASLKTLCWKIGQSFVKFSNHPKQFYGTIYRNRKEYEILNNEDGKYADQAREILENKKIGKDTDAYKYYTQGKLPPAHIQRRAERYTVKLFLSHWHQVAYFEKFGNPAPAPYVIERMGHVDFIPVPNWPFDVKQE